MENLFPQRVHSYHVNSWFEGFVKWEGVGGRVEDGSQTREIGNKLRIIKHI